MSAFSSSSRSASGAAKGRFQQQNINSVFASKGSSASKASGPSKHGLQSLGKQTTAVRRMPPPATLPSLRAESAGQDPAVALVPQGGTGWGTQTQSSTDSGKSAVDSSVNGSTKLEQDQRNAAQGALSGRAGSSPSAGGPDLRPTWAKADQTPISATNTRDFPTLSAAATKTTPIPEGAGSLKPQKSGSWKAGGGSAQSKSELENQQNLLNQQAQEQKQLRGESVGEEQATTTTTSNRASIDRDSPHTATGGGADHAQPSTTRPYLASSTTSSNNPPNRGPPVPPPARYYGGGGGGYGSGGGGPAPYSQPPSLHHQQQQSKPPHGYGQQSNYGGGGAGMPPMHGSNQAPPPRGYGSQDARYQQSQSSPQNQNSGYPPPPQQQRPSSMYDGGGGGAYGPPPMTSSRPPAYDVMPPSESPPVSSNRGDYQPTNQQQGGGYGPPHGGYARRPMPPPIAENDENYDDVDDYPGPYRRSDEPRVMWSDDEDSMGPPRGRGPPPHPSVRYHDDRYDGPPPMGPPPPASADWYRQPPMRPGGHGDGGPGPGPYGPPMPPQQRGGPPPPSGGWGGGPSGPHRGGPPMGYGPGPQQPPMDRRPGGPPMPPPPQQQQHQRFGNYQPVQMGGNRMVVDVDKEDADEEHRQMQQTMEREAAIERSRQKRRLAQQGSIPSEGEYGPIGSGPPMRPVDPFDQPPNENDRPSSRDSYGRSHGAKRELPPRLQQKQKDRAAAAAGGNFDEAGNKVGGDRRWDARAGGDYADVNGGNGMTGGKSRRRVKQPRKDADDRLGPEVRLLKRPDSKDSASSAEADLGRSSSDRSMTVESSRRVATTYEDDDEELNLTKLSRPAARVIKRVAPNPQQSSADKDGGKTQQQTQQKPQREKQRPAAPQSQSAASADAKGDAKQSEDAAAAAALATEFKEAPPPAENIWEKRMEERESAEREKQVVIGGSLDGADDDFQDLQMPQQHQRRQQFQPQQQQHNVNPRDPHAQTRRPTKEEWQAGAPTAPPAAFRGNREFVNSRRTRGTSVTAVGGGRGRARGGPIGAVRRGGSLPHRQHPHGQAHPQHQHLDSNGSSSMILNQDNFANMGEFHADANGSVIEGDAPSVVAMPTGNGVLDVDDEQPQDGAAKRGGMTAGGVGRSGARTAPVRGNPGRAGRYQPYIDQNVYSYNNDGQYQPQQPPTNGTYGRGRAGSAIGQRSSRGGGMATAPGHGGRMTDPRNGGPYVARRGGDGSRASHPHERGKRKKNDDEGGDGVVGSEEVAMTAGHREQRRGGGVHRTRGSGLRQRRPSGGRQDQGAGHPASAKSPVASEGYDEWETASESSDIGSRRHSKDPLANQEVNGNGNRKSTQPRFSQQRRERPPRGGPLRAPKDGAKSPSNPADADKGANSKNAKPASHLQGNQPNASTKRRGEVLEDSNDTSACKNTDGLAGFDINNAGVIVIDDQPDVDGHSERGFDDFEEVLSKKEKRARQQRLQELQEKEEKRRLRERERQEKLQQKKRSHEKQHAEKRAAAAAASESAAPATITVWNSATAGGNGASERKLSGTPDAKKGSMLEQATVTTMPSPIARPTPKNKQTAQSAATAVVLPSPADMSASSGTMPAGNSKTGVEIWGSPDVASYGADGQPASHLVDELGRPTPAKSVEFPASFGSPPELDPSDKFDFTFDPNLPTNDSSTRQSPVLGPVGDIPAPTAMNGAKLTSSSSLGDQQQLQEKLDKVKDIWPGGDEAAIVSSAASLLVSQQLGSSSVAVETSPAAASKSSLAEGPHVAKVRPQPQTNEGGPSSASANAFHVHQQQASKPTPPTSAIGPYSMCLPSMAPPVASFQLTTSSPPNFSLQPQQPQAQMGGPMQRSPFDHPQMFAHPPPSAMPWSTGGGQMDMLAGIGAPSQPPQNIGGQQQQRQQPPPPGIGFQQSSASQQQPATYGLPPPPPGSSLKTAMAGGFGPLMSAPPPDFVNVAQPPPMLGAVGSQRSQARPQLPTQLQLGAIGSQAFTGYLPPSAPTNQHQHQHQHQHQPPNSFVAPPPLGQPRFTGPPPTLGALDLSQTMGPPPPMFAKPQGPNAGWNGPPPPNKTAVNPNAANFGPFGSMKFGGFAQQMTANPSANQRQGPAPIQPMPSSTTNQRGSGPAPIQRPTNHGQPLPTRRPPSAHLHHDGGKEGSDLLLQQSIDRFISDGGDEQQAKKIGH